MGGATPAGDSYTYPELSTQRQLDYFDFLELSVTLESLQSRIHHFVDVLVLSHPLSNDG
jgi:hypothetical protein